MRIAVYARPVIDNTSASVVNMLTQLKNASNEVFIYDKFYTFLQSNSSVGSDYKTFSDYTEVAQLDYMLSIGGDGTLLETIAMVRNSGVPVLGINTGRLGFLANVSKDEINNAIGYLLTKNFSFEKRSLLQLNTKNNLFGDINYALNEITITKKDSTMMTIHAFLDGEFLNSYWADGLIVATPTGSTAYSLSCGGPLMVPDAKSFVITPIAPHNLTVRPLIIPDDKVLTLKIEGRSKEFLVTLDSRSASIDSSFELVIHKADFKFNLIRFENQSFFTTIRNKLNWGLDKRN
ncbi:MAG: NAD kinase [Bacteroidetes bacterium]|nr:NAD kinase [Bacteroidota bacterium]